MTQLRQFFAAALILLPLSFSKAIAADVVINAIDGVAMDGFDVVAYFRDERPRKGNDQHVVEYKGVTWKFHSAENAQDFRNNPTAFEPLYNGWCAYAVSEGYAAEVDFINGWSILDGKLYLNWNASVSKSFRAEQQRRRPKADKNWPGVHDMLVDGSLEISRHKVVFGVGIKHPQELSE